LDENDGLDIENVDEDIGHAQHCDDPLLDGDITDLVYPTVKVAARGFYKKPFGGK
jgi:hypothetical protein